MKEKTSQEIAIDFVVMCAFIEFSPDFPEEERDDYLYKKFVKTTGLRISKEKLAELLDEEMNRKYEIVADVSDSMAYVKSATLGLKIIGIDPAKPNSDETVWKVKVNDFKDE